MGKNDLVHGFAVSCILQGILFSQISKWSLENKDKWHIRIMVLILFALDVAESIIDWISLRNVMIGIASEGLKEDTVLTGLATVNFVLSAIVFFIVHVYLAIILLNAFGNMFLSGAILLCTIPMFIVAIVTAAGGPEFRNPVVGIGRVGLILTHTLGSFADVFVSVGFIWTFSGFKTAIKPTRIILRRLMLFFVTRGIALAVIQVAHLATALAGIGGSWLGISLHMAQSKLYVITLLAMLNSRQETRDAASAAEMVTFRIKTSTQQGTQAVRSTMYPIPIERSTELDSRPRSVALQLEDSDNSVSGTKNVFLGSQV